MDKKFDTSGSVSGTVWSDLSPFAQGYVEALMTDPTIGHRIYGLGRAFRYLAPEPLARIIADCEAGNGEGGTHPSAAEGRAFYDARQAAELNRFPPLTVQLCDDGKVRFAA